MEVFYGEIIYKWAIYTMAMLVITRLGNTWYEIP